MKTVLAWYFAEESRKLRYDDGREIVVGVTHRVRGKPGLCGRGLHGSVRLLDALRYAPGPVVYRVELSGNMDVGGYKIAATCRKYIAGGIDISDTLREFARRQALSVAHLWDMPATVREYLETGDESKRYAVRDAEWDAAWAAARDAEWAAAMVAAWAAARDTAWYAARDAEWAAARAARAAARDAEWDAERAARAAANDMLTEMVERVI